MMEAGKSTDTRTASKRPKLLHRIFKTRIFFTDLIEETAHTLYFNELTETLPKRITSGLELSSFALFLKDDHGYSLQHVEGRLKASRIAFNERSSTVAHLRRSRRLVPVNTHAPDPWLLLAPPLEVASLEAVHAQFLLPLEGRHGLVGFAAIARPAAQRFTWYEQRQLRALGVQWGQALEAAITLNSLSLEAAHRERIAKELELAREVQERLFPQRFPTVPGISIAGASVSAEEVGGDYYDAFVTPDGLLCGAVGDVSGKGISSALLMATLRASLRTLMLQKGAQLANMMPRLNRLIFEASSQSRYATFFVFLYNPEAATLTYVNAGHNPPLLFHHGEQREQVIRLSCGGPVIGLFDELPYQQETVPFRPGDTLIAYTDGVSEACSPQGKEFGEEALLDSITTRQSARQKMDSIFAGISNFVGGAPQRDDMTMLVMQSELSQWTGISESCAENVSDFSRDLPANRS